MARPPPPAFRAPPGAHLALRTQRVQLRVSEFTYLGTCPRNTAEDTIRTESHSATWQLTLGTDYEQDDGQTSRRTDRRRMVELVSYSSFSVYFIRSLPPPRPPLRLLILPSLIALIVLHSCSCICQHLNRVAFAAISAQVAARLERLLWR